jgi:hypothetical protein
MALWDSAGVRPTVLVTSRKEIWSMEIKKIYVNDNEKGTLISTVRTKIRRR